MNRAELKRFIMEHYAQQFSRTSLDKSRHLAFNIELVLS